MRNATGSKSMLLSIAALFPALIACGLPALPAQCSLNLDEIGRAVADLGDVDGDHCDDYLVGAPGLGGTGRVWCHSGRTGVVLWQMDGIANLNLGRALASAGDLTGDGINDAMLGAPGTFAGPNSVRLVNGATGALISILQPSNGISIVFGVEFGGAVAGLGDIDGDAVPDLLVGAPNYAGGRAFVYSGATLALIRTHLPTLAVRFGQAVAGGRDFTGDGVPDYVVGDPAFGGGHQGRVTFFNGATGSVVATKDGDGSDDYFGYSVALIPGHTFSGNRASIVVGAPESDPFVLAVNGPGYVRIFRGASTIAGYGTMATWVGPLGDDRFGTSVAFGGDLDDDGSPEVLIGAPGFGGIHYPYVQARSLAGTVLFEHWDNGWWGDLYGYSLAGRLDTDADAVPDIVVGIPLGDDPCPDAGSFEVLHPRIPPRSEKVLITEVTTGNPQGLEIANFGSSAATLTGWTVLWRGALVAGGLVQAALPAVTLQPGEIVVVKEPGGTLAETPFNTQVLNVLPGFNQGTGPAVVGVRNHLGLVIDEVRIAGVGNTDPGFSVGGLFRGHVQNVQPGPFATAIHVERIWGLDSNGGSDWTSHGTRTFGLENTSGGLRGLDPIPVADVVINEVDHNPEYVELKVRGASSVNVQNWSLMVIGGQGIPLLRLRPWPSPELIPAGGFFVVGNSVAPAELPSLVPYANLNALGSPLFILDEQEYSCAVYDHYGRLVDLVRMTGHDDGVVHNHPRAPSHWQAFTGAAQRAPVGEGSQGRNLSSTDTNTGSDWRPMTVRTMGSGNGTGPFTWTPDPTPILDVRLNATGLGGGLAIILNAGSAHSGEGWTLAFDLGHYQGQGPVMGLGPNALNNLIWASMNPPFVGSLDARGSARLDVPPGSVTTGLALDAIFLLFTGTQITSRTAILELDI